MSETNDLKVERRLTRLEITQYLMMVFVLYLVIHSAGLGSAASGILGFLGGGITKVAMLILK